MFFDRVKKHLHFARKRPQKPFRQADSQPASQPSKDKTVCIDRTNYTFNHEISRSQPSSWGRLSTRGENKKLLSRIFIASVDGRVLNTSSDSFEIAELFYFLCGKQVRQTIGIDSPSGIIYNFSFLLNIK